ncbi:MAG TPA: tail fiber protein [Acidimicrobiales bacterium]|jgi:microcystin-dependent protein|nr:tail fiber protein [Acidimicrobiales bacterium]
MGEPFMGEIRLMAFNFPPKGWAFCNGQFLPIDQNQALFSLLGTTFGGNGQTTFALPDLRGRWPFHLGQGLTLGQAGGEASHTLSLAEMPTHNHFVVGDKTSGNAIPNATSRLANSKGQQLWGPPNNIVPMAPPSLATTGGSQAHENRPPYLAISFCIALQGIFPSKN